LARAPAREVEALPPRARAVAEEWIEAWGVEDLRSLWLGAVVMSLSRPAGGGGGEVAEGGRGGGAGIAAGGEGRGGAGGEAGVEAGAGVPARPAEGPAERPVRAERPVEVGPVPPAPWPKEETEPVEPSAKGPEVVVAEGKAPVPRVEVPREKVGEPV